MESFFILGAPRSGTTMLRDIFKQVDELYSPEETHFFRFAAPYRGREYVQFYKNNPVLKKHREMDGVGDEDFFALMGSKRTKSDFTKAYCELVAKKKGAKAWFEKTPQNVYGLPLIIDQFPDAKIIHLVRHPLSVVKSLMEGKVMMPQGFIGGLNYWLESISIINVLKPAMGDRLIEVKYEDIQSEPYAVLSNILSGLGVKDAADFDLSHVHSEIKIPYEYFSSDQLQIAGEVLSGYPEKYGYSLIPGTA